MRKLVMRTVIAIGLGGTASLADELSDLRAEIDTLNDRVETINAPPSIVGVPLVSINGPTTQSSRSSIDAPSSTAVRFSSVVRSDNGLIRLNNNSSQRTDVASRARTKRLQTAFRKSRVSKKR
jgi:hypothetical protein